MIDKSRIINSAQKLAAKGHIDKAIAEWEKLLADHKDGNVYNTVGDLYLRKGAEKEASESFAKAAEIFRKDGFYPKAIAIYKKILNIAPNDVDALIASARLNADKGLVGNAIDNYYRAAEIYNREGAAEKATKVVDKMLQLTPSDISTRSKIAYLYFRIGHRERAANEYASIALTYLEKDDIEKSKEYFDKAVEHDPGNISALVGLSKLALKGNNQDQAFDSLDNALSQDPNNKEVLITYAKLAMESGRKDDAKRALALLIDLDPSNLETKTLLGTFYLEEGLKEEALEELLPVIDDALDSEKWSEAHELLRRFKDLQSIEVKERLLRICQAQGDENTILSELKELAAAYENEGSDQEALQAYKEAVELAPFNSSFSEKVSELELKLGISQASPDTIVTPVTGMEPGEIIIEPTDLTAGINAAPSPPEINAMPGTSGEAEALSDPGPAPAAPQADISHPEPAEQIMDQTHAPAAESMSEEEFNAAKSEADFYAQQGLNDEALKIYENLVTAFPDNEEVLQKLTALSSDVPRAEEISVEKEPEEKPLQKTAADGDLEALFSQFETAGEETADYEARYLAGLELKQKGLLDEAIKELRIAAKDPENQRRNGTMLALCYMGNRSYPLAIVEFNKIIEEMTPSDSSYLLVKYELANAHLQNKEDQLALELFSEIQAEDAEFKDVSSKVDNLRAGTPHVQIEKPKPKRDRVSYI